MPPLQQSAHLFNRAVASAIRLPAIGDLLGRAFTIVQYTGRKSGRDIELVTNYRHEGERIIIGVGMPEKKTWWRNFTGEGAPITLELAGYRRFGHAVADKDSKGRRIVRVVLHPQ